MFMQKISGFIMILLSIIVTILDNDAGAAMMLVPLGLYLVFARKQVMFW